MTANVFPVEQLPHQSPDLLPDSLKSEFQDLVHRQAIQPDPTAFEEFLGRHGLAADAVDALLVQLAASYGSVDHPTAPTPIAQIPAQRSAPPPDSIQASTEAVADASEDLLGDWIRAGRLTNEQVATTAADYELSAEETAELYELLSASGVSIERRNVAREYRPAERAVDKSAVGDSVGLYLRQIARYRLIDAGREVELWSAISQGLKADDKLNSGRMLSSEQQRQLRDVSATGRRAHRELVCANLRLVVSIARSFLNHGVEFSDLIQWGNLG